MTAQRPRDDLGRPLAWDVDPALASAPVPATDGLTDEQVWLLALDLLDRRAPFHAHEVLERRWRSAAAGDRDAWRALAQWGAALTHEARGNAVGARRLADRAVASLASAEHVPSCIDVAAVRESCARLSSEDTTPPTE